MQMKRILRICRVAKEEKVLVTLLLLAFMTTGPMARAAAGPAQDFLVEGGKAKAVIVVGDNADPLYRFVGEELQRYVQAITGGPSVVERAGKEAEKKSV